MFLKATEHIPERNLRLISAGPPEESLTVTRYMLVVNRQGTTDSFPTPLQDHAGCKDTWESVRSQISLSFPTTRSDPSESQAFCFL